jgi:RNA polymerase sigma-70 factor (ECF subfamily)
MVEDAYRAHRADLLGFARRRLGGDHGLAEEAVQETFLRAWRSAHQFDPSAGSPRMWLFGICRNTTIDVARRTARIAQVDRLSAASMPTEHPAPDEMIVDRDTDGGRRAIDVLRRLPTTQRDAVVAIHVHRRPYADVAAELGVPVGTVKSRVHFGLRSARDALAKAS